MARDGSGEVVWIEDGNNNELVGFGDSDTVEDEIGQYWLAKNELNEIGDVVVEYFLS